MSKDTYVSPFDPFKWEPWPKLIIEDTVYIKPLQKLINQPLN